MPGIILFLAYLGTVTGEIRYTTYAIAALRTLRSIVRYMITQIEQLHIGAFNGIGSCIYLFSHLARLWNDTSLLQEAEDLVRLLPERIVKDELLDIVDGSAGCIASLLSLYEVSPSPVTLATAILCGNRLQACGQPMDVGLGWKTFRQERPLAGFSHGTAGIAWSLLKLAAVSGEERFRQTVYKALAYERSLFSHEAGNWLDLRRVPQATQGQQKHTEGQIAHYGMSWSHGAPGIALARLASLCYMDDEITRQEIETALTAILEKGFSYHHEHIGPNHSLAHGDFGNLEVLLVAAQMLDTPYLHAATERIAMQLLESMRQHGCIMGVPLNVETPGLMIGLAGIGYQLLRLAEPVNVPSILSLALPRAM